MDKVITAVEAIKKVKDGNTLLIGGFLQCGAPETLTKTLLENSDAKGLTIIASDTGTSEMNTCKVMEKGRVVKVYASYIGANRETGRMYLEDSGSVTLVPQGTLAERIRAGGAGIRGFYTPVGVGTIVEEGKEKKVIDGVECLLEYGITGDVALVKAAAADKSGNLFMRASAKNFNAIMARAAEYVIAEAEKIVEVGELDPEMVTVPGIFVDAVVQAEV